MKKIILSIKNWIRNHRHPDESVILVSERSERIQNRFWSRYKTPSLPRMTPGRITIIFSALFISFLSIIMFRNQISSFFQATGNDPVAYWKFALRFGGFDEGGVV